MYPNLKGEMAKRDLTQSVLVDALDLTPSTVSQKLSGKYPITLKEAKIIKMAIGTDLTLEELFEEKTEEAS